ncbi:unnamed protein product [Amoebophrya sp. A25]|nr:unnamed protein product [Amoebophrya sp. A25]|eukprot:GSA25T00005389001.1
MACEDMQEMQRQHETILLKTLNTYRQQMETLKTAFKAQQESAAASSAGASPGRATPSAASTGSVFQKNASSIAFAQPRSVEGAFRSAYAAVEASSSANADPAYPRSQSMEFRMERLLTYSRRLLQENELLRGRLDATTSQRDRVLKLKMPGGGSAEGVESLSEKVALMENERDELRVQLARSQETALRQRSEAQLEFTAVLQSLVDQTSGVLDSASEIENPVYSYADELLNRMKMVADAEAEATNQIQQGDLSSAGNQVLGNQVEGGAALSI